MLKLSCCLTCPAPWASASLLGWCCEYRLWPGGWGLAHLLSPQSRSPPSVVPRACSLSKTLAFLGFEVLTCQSVCWHLSNGPGCWGTSLSLPALSAESGVSVPAPGLAHLVTVLCSLSPLLVHLGATILLAEPACGCSSLSICPAVCAEAWPRAGT